jgi:hypothetical protein
MRRSLCCCIGVAALVVCTLAQSADVHQARQSILRQPGSPLKQSGAMLVLRNVSDKRIVSYVLACFARSQKKYSLTRSFDESEESIGPGEFTSVGGFDATPFNVCRSQTSLLGVASVKFADGSSWQSPFMKSGADASRP